MSTGYTYNVKDGISFAEFAMQCARAFGACVSLRDEPADTPIPEEFVVPSYYSNGLTKSHAAVVELDAMSDYELESAAQAEYEDELQRIQEQLAEIELQRERYREMIGKVHNWQPPTDEHTNLKDFMLEQLHTSLDFDCSEGIESHYREAIHELELLTGEQWREKTRQRHLSTINHIEEQVASARARAEGNTDWIKALRESLKGEE